MLSGETKWVSGSAIRIRRGSLTIKEVDRSTRKAFEKHRDELESGELKYSLTIKDGRCLWKIYEKGSRKAVPYRRKGPLKSVKKAAVMHLRNKAAKISPDELERRKKICSACKFVTKNGGCSICGCTALKKHVASESCPQGKWAPVSYIQSDLRKMFEGESVVIVGGGPSLENPKETVESLVKTGHKMLGVNDAFLLPGVDMTVYCDSKWGSKWNEELRKSKCYVVCAASTEGNYGHHLGRGPGGMRKEKQYANSLSGVGWYTHTGATAIQIAIACLPKQILLIGFDGKRTEEASNWHPNELDSNPPKTYDRFRTKLDKMMGDFKERGDVLPPIYNLNPDSAYQCFEKRDIKEFL